MLLMSSGLYWFVYSGFCAAGIGIVRTNGIISYSPFLSFSLGDWSALFAFLKEFEPTLFGKLSCRLLIWDLVFFVKFPFLSYGVPWLAISSGSPPLLFSFLVALRWSKLGRFLRPCTFRKLPLSFMKLDFSIFVIFFSAVFKVMRISSETSSRSYCFGFLVPWEDPRS